MKRRAETLEEKTEKKTKREVEVFAFDVKTGGTNPIFSPLFQLSIVDSQNTVKDWKNKPLKTLIPSPQALLINKITVENIKIDFKNEDFKTALEVYQFFLQNKEKKYISYNTNEFDKKIISSLLSRNLCNTDVLKESYFINFYFILQACKRFGSNETSIKLPEVNVDWSLENLKKINEINLDSHNAIDDAKVLIQLYHKIKNSRKYQFLEKQYDKNYQINVLKALDDKKECFLFLYNRWTFCYYFKYKSKYDAHVFLILDKEDLSKMDNFQSLIVKKHDNDSKFILYNNLNSEFERNTFETLKSFLWNLESANIIEKNLKLLNNENFKNQILNDFENDYMKSNKKTRNVDVEANYEFQKTYSKYLFNEKQIEELLAEKDFKSSLIKMLDQKEKSIPISINNLFKEKKNRILFNLGYSDKLPNFEHPDQKGVFNKKLNDSIIEYDTKIEVSNKTEKILLNTWKSYLLEYNNNLNSNIKSKLIPEQQYIKYEKRNNIFIFENVLSSDICKELKNYQNIHLKDEIIIRDCSFKSVDIKNILNELSDLKFKFKNIEIMNNNFNHKEDVYINLSNYLYNQKDSLTYLNLNDNNIDSDGIELLSKKFPDLKNLQKLNLQNNLFTYGIDTLGNNCEFLNLKILDLSNTGMKENIHEFAKCFSKVEEITLNSKIIKLKFRKQFK